MIKKIKELGMNIRKQMYLQRILKNPEGRVCGVLVRDGYQFPDPESGVPKYIRAKKALILATGSGCGLKSIIPWGVSRSTHRPRS